MLSRISSIVRVDFTARKAMRIIGAFAGKMTEHLPNFPFSRLFRWLFFAFLKRYESKTRSRDRSLVSLDSSYRVHAIPIDKRHPNVGAAEGCDLLILLLT
ncbi:hypothetical protein [Pseudomonas frederiksbergensis]|uniref:Uncharacterized protein n=1 Tax=Pseudomonas frederiksbergensis TaxID=104087 RepID=A0A423HGQ4_9PSED|nr:hypothetical protein [Pseudomonas frederiksbergensis]RON12344.1 hypothetical protein BK662_25340 [Pseudomonas frederiksbergensis]